MFTDEFKYHIFFLVETNKTKNCFQLKEIVMFGLWLTNSGDQLENENCVTQLAQFTKHAERLQKKLQRCVVKNKMRNILYGNWTSHARLFDRFVVRLWRCDVVINIKRFHVTERADRTWSSVRRAGWNVKTSGANQ